MSALLALGAALLHALWQGAILAALFRLALVVLERPQTRYLAGCATLVAMAALPVATFFSLWTPAAAATTAAGAARAAEAAVEGSRAARSLLPLVAAAWLLGVLVLSARLSCAFLLLRRRIAAAVPLPESWQARLAALSARLGVARVVELRTSPKVSVPEVVGWVAPVILLPVSALTALSPAQLEAILAHELAHVRRLDYLANLLQSAVEIALFHHPLVWWVSHRVRIEREYCADDAALELLADRSGYARALADLEALRLEAPGLAVASTGTGGPLMLRIRRILNPTQARPIGGALPALLAASALLAGLLYAHELGATPHGSVEIPWLPPVLERWKPALTDSALRHHLDPDALAIIALVESGGDASARSPVGALGLLQLMPETAARLAQARGLPRPTEEQLLDPAYNLDLGAEYFARQLASFGELELAAAAYNAGETRLHAWLEHKATLPKESERYRDLVGSLWNERGAARSAAYEGWRGRVRARTLAGAESPVPGTVTLAFGAQTHPFSGEPYFHQGLDLASEPGAPVHAPLPGTVAGVEEDEERGRVVVLRHANGIESRFHHLGSIEVSPGQSVARGDTVGTAGATGKVTGPHVHFELRDQGAPVDPAPYLSR
jgi:murein DD-endopeptidase MepM/ murein hydrolase activator NlpD/beta-lactamase regulating signal transducer with metallopeptidase domain